MAYDCQVFLPANGKLVAVSRNVRHVDRPEELYCLEPWCRDGNSPDWVAQSRTSVEAEPVVESNAVHVHDKHPEERAGRTEGQADGLLDCQFLAAKSTCRHGTGRQQQLHAKSCHRGHLEGMEQVTTDDDASAPEACVEDREFPSASKKLEFLEHAVCGQVHLAVNVADFTGIHEERTVVGNAVFAFFDKACADRDVVRKLTEAGEFGAVGAAHDVKRLVLECVSGE